MIFRKKESLTDSQRLLYKLEELPNFRWVQKFGLTTKSKYVLTSANFASPDLVHELSEAGQFAEIAYGLMSPELVWEHLELLSKVDFPLEGYTALAGTTLVATFRGTTAGVPGHIAYRPDKQQVVVAFSGTATFMQSVNDVDAHLVQYPFSVHNRSCKVHAGFLRMYKGVRGPAFTALRKALKEYDVREILITGHSLGAALSYLFILELLPLHREHHVPEGVKVKHAVFGAPRVGNRALVQLFEETVNTFHGERSADSFVSNSVKAYNDGVPALPPHVLGYRHFTSLYFFLHHGCLYQIPPSEKEHTVFDVKHDEEGYSPALLLHPRGGHTYYNGRTMERVGKRIKWIGGIPVSGELRSGWENQYLERLAKDKRRQAGKHSANSLSAKEG
ncbi:alpha/beta-hydrolase [Rickenella mellea]|uniref:Alpha/beta-hydrolase n=1 Tax=Rickenella mellea TaxID=50990 RepID=A0A4Y7QKX3_9AGAM|nr:alpha/beta-hydrolase [Rickenella mellea]